MALIPCRECGKPISDAATSCPHCGRPVTDEDRVSARVSMDTDDALIRRRRRIQAWLWLVTLLCGVLLIPALSNPDDERRKSLAALGVCGIAVMIVTIAAIQSSIDKRRAKMAPKGGCPKCHSMAIAGLKEGYSAAGGCCGGMFLGPLGLLCGFLGADEVNVHCLECGHKWKARR